MTAPWAIIFGLTAWDLQRADGGGLATGIALRLLGLVAYARLAVTLHRLLLLGPGSVPGIGLSWSGRESQFLGWTIAISGFTAGIGYGLMLVLFPVLAIVFGSEDAPTGALAYVFLLVAMLPALYVSARWLLVLPATAIDRYCDLARAWRMSAGHGRKLLGMVVLFPLGVTWVLHLLIDVSFADPDGTGPLLLVAGISSLADVAATSLGIALLVAAYREISPGERPRRRPKLAGTPETPGPTDDPSGTGPTA